LPRLSGKEVVKILGKIGFFPARRSGSHVILTKQTIQGRKAVVVPMHKEIDKGTLLEIIRESELTKEEFLELMNH